VGKTRKETAIMPKTKSHKGLLKRIRVTGKGRVKRRRAFSGHLMSHKSGTTRQKLRGSRLVRSCDIGRMRKMLNCRVHGGDRGPETTPSQAELQAAASAEIVE
jgi:large subunit ribosomal protein L35